MQRRRGRVVDAGFQEDVALGNPRGHRRRVLHDARDQLPLRGLDLGLQALSRIAHFDAGECPRRQFQPLVFILRQREPFPGDVHLGQRIGPGRQFRLEDTAPGQRTDPKKKQQPHPPCHCQPAFLFRAMAARTVMITTQTIGAFSDKDA